MAASMAQRRGMIEVAPLALKGDQSKVAAPPLGLGAYPGEAQDGKDAKPSGIRARRGLVADVQPLAICALPKIEDMRAPSPRTVQNSAAASAEQTSEVAKPMSMAARRGLMGLGAVTLDTQKASAKPLPNSTLEDVSMPSQGTRQSTASATTSQTPEVAKPLSMAARRGLMGLGAVPVGTQKPPVKPTSLAAAEDARAPATCATQSTTEVSLHSSPEVAKPSSMAARRGLMSLGAVPLVAPKTVEKSSLLPAPEDAKPLSMAARRGLKDVGVVGSVGADAQKTAAKPLALCTRRNSVQLQLKVPALDLSKMHTRGAAFQDQPASPSPSLSGASTSFISEGEPVSPTLSDVSIEDWGYDIVDSLGQGTFGMVNSVRRRSDGSEFACKHVRSNDREQLIGLKREYELLHSLKHESIVCPYAFYQCVYNAWLCMEWCRGGTVQDEVRRVGAIAEPRAQQLALQLLAGVDFLHCRRVVHCDIKPANLLIQPEAGDLKICDFGSARRIGCAAAGRVMLSERGTQLYSAPELRFNLQWNERVDVWASGLCIFFMMRGELPFDGAARKVTKQLRAGCLPSLAWGGGVGEQMRDLVRQCLTVEMRDRPTAMELVRHGALGHLRPQPAAKASASFDRVLGCCGLLLLPEPARAALAAQQRGGAAREPREEALSRLVQNASARAAGQTQSAARTHESPL